MVSIRPEHPADIAAIRDVNERAFGRPHEGHIVDAIRTNGAVTLSLVAAIDERVVGHILYSPATVGRVAGAALGPVAVLPEYQRQGIGSMLIAAGNSRLRDAACPFIVLVGHPAYYPRFGFGPASARGIQCPWPVPDDAFMVLVLNEQAMQGVAGVAQFRDEFACAT